MPLSEGWRGLKPSRMRERVIEMDEQRFRQFTLKLIEYTAFVVLILTLAVIIGTSVVLWLVESIDHRRAILNDRQKNTNQQLHDLACLGLKYTPDGSEFHQRLRVIFPDCPTYSPTPTPTRTVPVPGPTKTRVVTRTPTPEALPEPTPPPSVRTEVIVSAGPTVTRTRTLTRTVHPSSPKSVPLLCRVDALGRIVYCP